MSDKTTPAKAAVSTVNPQGSKDRRL